MWNGTLEAIGRRSFRCALSDNQLSGTMLKVTVLAAVLSSHGREETALGRGWQKPAALPHHRTKAHEWG